MRKKGETPPPKTLTHLGWFKCKAWSCNVSVAQVRVSHWSLAAQIDSSCVPLLYPPPGTGNGVIKWELSLIHLILHVCLHSQQAFRRLWTCLCGNSLYFFNNAKDTNVSVTRECVLLVVRCCVLEPSTVVRYSTPRRWTSLVSCLLRTTAAGTGTWRQPGSSCA